MGKVFGSVAGVGAVGALYAMKRTWDPLPSVKAAGFTTIDLSVAEPNKLLIEKWRGKPIFILKKTPEMVEKQTKEDTARDVVVDGTHYLICIGLCTHLGCIPAYREDQHDFLCACHGGQYDVSGIVTKAPPPLPLYIPPFDVKGNTVVLGEEGETYKKMKAAGITV
jgi:ubiquinol-cytochrome c reductase iron-sulfur subunit